MPTEPTERVDHKAVAERLLLQLYGDTPIEPKSKQHAALVHSNLAIAEAIEIGGFGVPPHSLPPQTGLEVVLQRTAAALVQRGLTPEQVADSARIGAEREDRHATA